MVEEPQAILEERPRRRRRRSPLLRIKVKTWDPARFKELGRGGEATIYLMKDDVVAKVFHKPDAIEYCESTELQEAARVRLEEMQTKLFEFPADVPSSFVVPSGVLQYENGRVFGYVMPFVRGTSLDKFERTSSTLTPDAIRNLLLRLHDLVSALHTAGVVIGDFKGDNIIVSDGDDQVPYLIDADSTQFGSYQCRTFTPHFAAPEILRAEEQKSNTKGKKEQPQNPETVLTYAMVAPHSELTDWYSFLVLAMRLLTFTDPFGGVVPGMDFAQRFRERVTVFDPRVVYPQIAKPLEEVPRPVLELFFRAFELGERFVPDKAVFDALKVLTDEADSDTVSEPKKRRKKNAQTNGR